MEYKVETNLRFVSNVNVRQYCFSAMTVMLQVTERMLTLEVHTIQPAILYPNMTDISEFPL